MDSKMLNETTNIRNLYDYKEKNHLIENKSNYQILETAKKENELEIEQYKLSENIDELDLINDNIKNKYFAYCGL